MYAVLFDLDDTLYPERAYVRSGFRAVAQSIVTDTAAQTELFYRMLELFERSPERVFDRLISGFPTADWAAEVYETVSRLVKVYRNHAPQIHFYDDVVPTLSELRRRGIRLGIITDGRAEGQRAKVQALGVSELVDVLVFTDSLGPNRLYWKPHPRPFEIALSKLKVVPTNALYIGDNPTKDFQGPQLLGMRTVRIRRTDALNLFEKGVSGERTWCEAEHIIESLGQLVDLLRQWSWIE